MRLVLAFAFIFFSAGSIAQSSSVSGWSSSTKSGVWMEGEDSGEGGWTPECSLKGPKFLLEYYEAGALYHKREIRVYLEYFNDSHFVEAFVDGNLVLRFQKQPVAEVGVLGITNFRKLFIQELASGKMLTLRNGDGQRNISLKGSARAARSFLSCATR